MEKQREFDPEMVYIFQKGFRIILNICQLQEKHISLRWNNSKKRLFVLHMGYKLRIIIDIVDQEGKIVSPLKEYNCVETPLTNKVWNKTAFSLLGRLVGGFIGGMKRYPQLRPFFPCILSRKKEEQDTDVQGEACTFYKFSHSHIEYRIKNKNNLLY